VLAVVLIIGLAWTARPFAVRWIELRYAVRAPTRPRGKPRPPKVQ